MAALGQTERSLAVPLYDGAETLVVDRSMHGDYCDFRIVRQDGSTLIFIGGYAQRLRMNVYNADCARLSVGDSHVGLMTVADGQAVARFLSIDPQRVDDQ